MIWVNTAALATFALVGLGALVSIPPTGVAFDDACRPQGFRAWVSANISGEEFWESQLGAAKRELISFGQVPAGCQEPNQPTVRSRGSISRW